MLMTFFLLACGGKPTPPVNQPQNAIEPAAVQTESEEEPLNCFDACMKSRQMESRAIEAIEADCQRSCDSNTPPSPLAPSDPE